ncbi:hypothetical protein ACLB2K_041524 [Fragaria x ananassa]
MSLTITLNPSLSLFRSFISGTTSSPICGPHSFLHVSDAAVLAQARNLDEKLRLNEEVGPLAGVLVAMKDNICTAGSRVLEGYTPPYDATPVRKIKELGGIVVGKTNLDEFGMGSTTEVNHQQLLDQRHSSKKDSSRSTASLPRSRLWIPNMTSSTDLSATRILASFLVLAD